MSKFKYYNLLLSLPVAAFIALSSHSFADESSMKTVAIAEIVNFKLVDRADVGGFLKSNEEVVNFLKQQPGFVSRNLLRRADGSFMDYVVWATLDNAKAAMDASLKAPSLVPFMQFIDPASMDLKHESIFISVVK